MSSKPGTFKPGPDPRRNTKGNLNSEAQTWEILFRNALAKQLDPEVAADIVAKAYKRGQPWAVSETHKRLMEEPTQKHEHSGEMSHILTFAFGENGNGHTEKA